MVNLSARKCELDENLTMEWTIRMDTGRIRAKVGNYGFNAPAEVVDVRFVRARVDHSPLRTVRSNGKIGHHPRPEKFVSKRAQPHSARCEHQNTAAIQRTAVSSDKSNQTDWTDATRAGLP